jgi:uncharacterized protein YjdB
VTPPKAEQKVKWSTSDADIAAVDPETGLVTGVAEGVADITAETVGLTSGGQPMTVSAKVTVKAGAGEIFAESLTLNLYELTLEVGDKTTLSAEVSPESADQSVTWVSSSPSVARVSSSGVVTAAAPGTATVTVVTKALDAGGSPLAKICAVTVEGEIAGDPTKVSSVSLDRSLLELAVGQKEILTATVLPETAEDKSVAWQSGDPLVASVNYTTGEVTARAKGSAVVTVTTNDGGHRALCVIIVTDSGDTGGEANLDIPTPEEWTSEGIADAVAEDTGIPAEAIIPIDPSSVVSDTTAGGGTVPSFGDVSSILRVDQPVTLGGAVVAKGFSLPVRSASMEGGNALPFVQNYAEARARFKLLKVFSAKDSTDLLAGYPDLFFYENGAVKLKGKFVIVDGPAPDGAGKVGGAFGVSVKTHGGESGGEPYLYVYDGTADGRAVDPLVLAAKSADDNSPRGGGGCDSGFGALALLAGGTLFLTKKRKA